MEETPMLTTLKAKILRVCCCDLLVCDVCTCQEILVHMPRACCFSVGECVCIEYSGAMTMSIPPQITATDIRRVCGCCGVSAALYFIRSLKRGSSFQLLPLFRTVHPQAGIMPCGGISAHPCWHPG